MSKNAGVAGIAVVLVVAGCGTSSHHLDAAFLAKVDGACQHAIKDKQSHPFPLPSFDPRHPQAGELPQVGNYFASYGDAQQMIGWLNAAGEPAREGARWHKLRALVDEASNNSLVQQRVAKAADVKGFEHTLDVAQSLQKQIDKLGPDLGFTSSTACGRYFG